MINLFKRFMAWITRGDLVYLLDFDGEQTLSISRVNKLGVRTAARWWPWQHAICVLHKDGSVTDVSYVLKWKPYARTKQPTIMVRNVQAKIRRKA